METLQQVDNFSPTLLPTGVWLRTLLLDGHEAHDYRHRSTRRLSTGRGVCSILTARAQAHAGK